VLFQKVAHGSDRFGFRAQVARGFDIVCPYAWFNDVMDCGVAMRSIGNIFWPALTKFFWRFRIVSFQLLPNPHMRIAQSAPTVATAHMFLILKSACASASMFKSGADTGTMPSGAFNSFLKLHGQSALE
jgi:hypothetical protein